MKQNIKFTICVTLMFLLPFLILGWHLSNSQRIIKKNYAGRYLELRTKAGADITADMLYNNYNLSSLTNNVKFIENKKDFLKELIKEKPFIYTELALLSADGKEIFGAAAGNTKTGTAYRDSEPVRNAVKNRGSYGSVEFSEYNPPALITVEPFVDKNGKKAFIAGRLNIALVSEIIRRMGSSSYGAFGLVDGGGLVITDSQGSADARPGTKAPIPVLKLIKKNLDRGTSNTYDTVKTDKGEFIIAVAEVPGTAWWIYEVIHTSNMPAFRSIDVGRIITCGVLLIIGFGIISCWLGRKWLKD